MVVTESSYPLIHGLFYALCVAGVACADFYRPSWARTYTTCGRYAIAAAGYAAVFVGEFLLLYWGLLGLLPDDPSLAASFGGHPRFGAGWCALAATMATLAAPPVKRSLRLGLQAGARVPDHAWRLARELAEADCVPPPEVARDADALLALRGLDDGAEWLPIDRTMATLRRATALFLQLRAWEEKGRYRRFLAEARPRYDELRQRFDRLTFRTVRAIDQIESVAQLRLLVPAGDGAVAETADKLARGFAVDAIADLCAEIDALHRDVCLLVARAVLANEPRERGRCAAFRGLGFVPPARHRDQGYEALVEGVAWIFLGVFVYFYLAGSAGHAPPAR
jgi:hypothetical protein